MNPLLGLSLRALTHRLAPVVVAMVIAGTAATAWAYWTTNAAAGSTGAATAATVNQGATPSVTLTSIGREVSLSWGASTLSNGTAVTGYLVKRYPVGGGVATISPIGTCSGTVASHELRRGRRSARRTGSTPSRRPWARGEAPRAC